MDAARRLAPIGPGSRSTHSFFLLQFVFEWPRPFSSILGGPHRNRRRDPDVNDYRLRFVLPHAHIYRAGALWGLRRFSLALATVDQAERVNRDPRDGLVLMNIGCSSRARVHLSVGSADRALDALDRYESEYTPRGMEAEYYGGGRWPTHVLAMRRRPSVQPRRLRNSSARIEVRALVPWAHTVLCDPFWPSRLLGSHTPCLYVASPRREPRCIRGRVPGVSGILESLVLLRTRVATTPPLTACGDRLCTRPISWTRAFLRRFRRPRWVRCQNAKKRFSACSSPEHRTERSLRLVPERRHCEDSSSPHLQED